MSSAQHLREFISQRLTAAAEEIFSEFEKTIVRYEEEIDRQRRLLDVTWKPGIKLQRIDLQQHDCNAEKSYTDQQLSFQERNSILQQESPPIKEELEKLCISQDKQQPELKPETDNFMVTSNYMGSDPSEPEPNIDKILTEFSAVAESQDQEGKKQKDSDSTRNSEPKPKDGHHWNTTHSNNVETSSVSESQCNVDTNVKQHDCKEEKCLTEQHVCNQERTSSLDHQEPESPQITEEQEELCSIQEERQHKKRNDCEPEPNRDQLLTQNFYDAESRDQEGRRHTDSTRNEESNPNERHQRQKSYYVDNSPISEGHSYMDTYKEYIRCDFCGKAFKFISQMMTHRRVHTCEKPYPFKKCGTSFSQSYSLNVRMRTRTGEFFPCKTCGKSFKGRSQLQRHWRTHTGEKPYTCKVCGRSFSHNHHLTDHLRTHTGEKPYTCNTCGKHFTQSSGLTGHMRTHTGGKPYLCKICGKSFTQGCRLIIHMKNHTGERS
ncbi:uncharacterized protein PAE49_017071 [Odontesthes bonariensis]|uniref:uncharacterized protein LOC142400845 n=1 Tax=Odontesthes bonariensis TaxID=219752 RepID=UPI003F58C547